MTENIVESLDRPGPARRCSAGAVLGVLAAGLLAAAPFASGPLHAWAQRLPPSAAAEVLVAASEVWHEAMQRLGTAQWHDRLRGMRKFIEE